MKKEENILFSNVEINPDSAYVFYTGETKYLDTTTFLKEPLEDKYGKPVEIINILPNFPPPSITGSFIVVNNALQEYIMKNNGNSNFFLPIDQSVLNAEISDNPYINEIVEKILESQNDLYINLFKSTPDLTLPMKDERIKVIGPKAELFDYFDDKTTQREIMQRIDVPVPEGYVVHSFDELVETYKQMFQNNESEGRAFVSRDHGFGGNGSEIIRSLDDLLSSNKLQSSPEGDHYILMELMDLVHSPCAIGLVANENETMFVSVSDQIMDGVNYQGNVFPLGAGDKHSQKIKEYVLRIGKELGSKGYKGFYGIDFMIDKNDDLYFVEINPRKVGHGPEMMFAYNAQNPTLPSLSELEFAAVSNGTFGTDVSQYEMPEMNWGVSAMKAKEGQRTLNYIPRNPTEKYLFSNHGATVLEHPGENVTFLDDGKLTRIVCVAPPELNGASKDYILDKIVDVKSNIHLGY